MPQIRCPYPRAGSKIERLEHAAVFFAVVSLFLSRLMPTLPSADPHVSRLPLVALLGELGSGFLPGVYLSSCILICVLAHSLSRKRLNESHFFGTLPEACGQEQGENGLKRGGFAPCCEDKIGEDLRTVSPSVLACLGGW